MATTALHPLARQALVAAADPACGRWASGMTKYLAHDDAVACVRWALKLTESFIAANGDFGSIISRGRKCLLTSLEHPEKANLVEMEAISWETWNHRFATCGGNSLARLIWATMGVVMSVTPAKAECLTASRTFPIDADHAQIAEGLIWGQCATAVEVLTRDHPNIVLSAAHAFTKLTCPSVAPTVFTVQSQFKWTWEDLLYESAVLQTLLGHYLRFTDPTANEFLFSVSFPAMKEVNDHIELLKHRPRRIHIVPVVSDGA